MKWTHLLAIPVLALALTGCASRVQDNVAARQAAVEQDGGMTSAAEQSYVEARMMNRIEKWKDDELKVVNVYFFNPASGELLINPVRCIGTPVSTTEDLEPNEGSLGASAYQFRVPSGEEDIYTNEVAGRDTTFGDEVPAYECLTVDGQYMRWPPTMPHLVSSASFTFAPPTVARDLETEVKLEQAKVLIQRGCTINPETLEVIQCPPEGQAPVAPTATVEGE